MKIAEKIREEIRQRANYACEFCGVTEIDIGNLLTVDHFQPRSKGGSESTDNLIYCCMSCNLYKLNYWPQTVDDLILWNPRKEPFSQHFFQLEDGSLCALTPTGKFTLKRLRLNRQPLIMYRLKKSKIEHEKSLSKQYQNLIQVMLSLQKQLATLLEDQKELLREQENLIKILLKRRF